MVILLSTEMISSLHAWRRDPGDALQAALNSLKLPSVQDVSKKQVDSLTEVVSGCVQREAYTEALSYIDLALREAQQAGDAAKQALASYLRLHVQVLQEDGEVIQDLPRCLQQIRSLYKEAGDTHEEEAVLKDLLEFYLNKDDTIEARKQKDAICGLYDNQPEVAAATLRVAAVYFGVSKTAEAQRLAEEALDIYRRLGDKDGEAHVLQSIAVIHLSKRALPAAVQAAEGALVLLAEEKQKAIASCIIAQIHYAAEGFDAAAAAYRAARAKLAEEGLKAEEVEVLQLLAEMHLQNGKEADSIVVAKESVAVAKAAGNAKGQVKGLQLLAHIFAKKAVGESEAFALQAFEQAQAAGDTEEQAASLAQAGDQQLRRNDFVGAAQTARKALDLSSGKGGQHRRSEATALTVLGQAILAATNDGVSAEGMQHIKEALDIFRSLRDIYGMQTTHHLLANGYFARGDLEEGLANAREALGLYRQTGVSEQDALKKGIEDARAFAAARRMEKPKKFPMIGGVASLPPGPQCCPLKYSRVPKYNLDVAVASRKYWGIPRQAEQDLQADDARPPSHAVIWSYSLSDNSPTQTCVEFGHLVSAMAKGDVSKIPIIVQTCGVQWRMVGDMGPSNMTNVAAVTLWGFIRTVRQELPQLQITLLDFSASFTAAEIPRMIKPNVPEIPESAFYHGLRYEPQLTQVPSIFTRGNRPDTAVAGGGKDESHEKKTKFMRKSFQWVGSYHKLDTCSYREEWKAVGPGRADIGAMPPPPPVLALRKY